MTIFFLLLPQFILLQTYSYSYNVWNELNSGLFLHQSILTLCYLCFLQCLLSGFPCTSHTCENAAEVLIQWPLLSVHTIHVQSLQSRLLLISLQTKKEQQQQQQHTPLGQNPPREIQPVSPTAAPPFDYNPHPSPSKPTPVSVSEALER